MSKAKKILFIVTQSEMGGAQRFLLNLISRINSRYDISVAIGSDGKGELHEKLKTLNIPVSTLKNLKREISPVNDIKACFEIRDLINTFRPDTLFLLSSKAGFFGSLASRFTIHNLRFKVIYRIGGWTFNDPWPAWKKRLWINLEKLSSSWKDTIIVNNQHDFEQAQKLNIKPREKIILIHNGIDPYKLDFLPRDEARVKLF